MRLTIATCLACALALGSVAMAPAMAATDSAAAEAGAAAPSAHAKKRSKTKKHRMKVIPSSSAETPAQRERRLLRECKGQPNAGACLGYTR